MIFECEVCARSVNEVQLHRVNEKGVPGIWRCPDHLTTKIDPVVEELCDIIQPRHQQEGA